MSQDYKRPLFYPKIWMGSKFRVWISVLKEHGFRFSPKCLHSVMGVFLVTPLMSFLSFVESLISAKKVANYQERHDPVFVIGHWRSGTTLLHELLAKDKQFTFPDTYQCFFPSVFLYPGPILRKLVGYMLPDTRPMDSMPMGIGRPQEDEFALCILGAPSPYRGILFSSSLQKYSKYFNVMLSYVAVNA